MTLEAIKKCINKENFLISLDPLPSLGNFKPQSEWIKLKIQGFSQKGTKIDPKGPKQRLFALF